MSLKEIRDTVMSHQQIQVLADRMTQSQKRKREGDGDDRLEERSRQHILLDISGLEGGLGDDSDDSDDSDDGN
jgi:hypothetical protein